MIWTMKQFENAIRTFFLKPDPGPPRVLEDPYIREIRDVQYRARRGSWRIADVPVLHDPPPYEPYYLPRYISPLYPEFY